MSEKPPMRIVVIGTSGSGKTYLGQQLATALDIPFIELDSLHWAPNWQVVPADAFAAAVDQATSGPCWVADGNYSAVRHLVWGRATHMVWLNYGRMTVLRRVLWRTLSRAWTRKPLYSGNRESFRSAFLSKDSIILWSMGTYRKNRQRYAQLSQDPAYAHLQWTEVRDPRHTQALIESIVQTGHWHPSATGPHEEKP